ncbi:helix-turn-helix domain-containing protein [Rhodococcus sp. X156]|uniref:helix-turn-helix domain-containing protein n=1 Tax=Rhodococcus sp. X156 TaxID=2499145 RepID=UPI000FDA6B36|nr:helix-turn-helix domain-containing protein [Rhodococcus sp. X156]
MVREPEPVERDSRGILDPWLLRQRVRLTRYPVQPELLGLVDRFWAVQWDLPAGQVHAQQVLTHPGANLSVGHADGRSSSAGSVVAECAGVSTGLTTRTLTGRGWTVAALTTPGGLGAFLDADAATLTDRTVPLGAAIGVDTDALVAQVSGAADEAARVGVLTRALVAAVRPSRAGTAREVARLARVAETDRTVRGLADLCTRAAVGPRTLQRKFLRHAGVPPTWVLRRYRLLDAAEAVRDGRQVVWAEVAVEMGYADQAHLIRDFRAALGQTPAAYAQAQARRAERG